MAPSEPASFELSDPAVLGVSADESGKGPALESEAVDETPREAGATAASTGRNTPFSMLSEDGTAPNNASSMGDCSATPRTVLYLNETIDLMFDRWDQICKAFFSAKTNKYDLTKVPDVYDMVKYDILHNSHLNLRGIEELYKLSDAFENCVVPQEYGTDEKEKRYIGSKMCSALLEKINLDLDIALKGSCDDNLYQLDESHAPDLRINSLGRSVRTRLYFTSESHMHTLLNVLRFPAEGHEPIICKEGLERMDNISEISYLSQIVIRLFEDRLNPLNFHCELSFSPGAVNDPLVDKSNTIAPYVLLDKGITYGVLIDHLQSAIELSRQEGADKTMGHRHGSVTVNMDQAGNSDGWENADGTGDGEMKKKKKDKKDKKDKEKEKN
jgi:inositol hexakisphosphate/diphosphoinositol-pentakisphosphate kinase